MRNILLLLLNSTVYTVGLYLALYKSGWSEIIGIEPDFMQLWILSYLIFSISFFNNHVEPNDE